MRYFKHTQNDEVRQVPHDDDATFMELEAARLEDSTPTWAQTYRQDADVRAAIVAGVDGFGVGTPAVAAAADGTEIIGEAKHTGVVTSIVYVPKVAITGANTESRTLTVVNKGQDGTGTTVIGTLALTSGINAAAFDAKAYTLSGTAANKRVVAGDILAAVSTHVGTTGLADPGGRVSVTIDPE